ncbi:hypothetical protein CCY99_04980 [Helicobacter sp. 16-1353]|uniref:chaperone NapD n=1 Tax=Helicobacter sp. 16-1353 TaxID=2004996 RepID=UPI000DCDB4C2|nr:chaperone NapD [Helicobacter sp. 16-1353]RAX54037.1 hypothetical protein CCY99_04980 [Helicobacter sp. 16-1353]
MNISSIIIKTLVKNREKCADNLSKIDGVEVALSQDSTIIVTIEAPSTNEEIEIFKKIEATDGVIAASMHYTYFEDELKEEIKNMNDEFTHILNDDSIPIEQVKYTGSVNYMMNNKKKRM